MIIPSEMLKAAHLLARHGLVTAFGHLSQRQGDEQFVMTPSQPLASLTAETVLVAVALSTETLPQGAPGEAWIHGAIYRARPDVQAICRAQPEIVHVVAAAGIPVRPLHGQGVWVDPTEIPVFDEAHLIRSRALGEQLAHCLGSGQAVIMRGNGAVTVGRSIGEAVTRMWLLEVSARFNWMAARAGEPKFLNEAEVAGWQKAGEELLPRLWSYLKQ